MGRDGTGHGKSWAESGDSPNHRVILALEASGYGPFCRWSGPENDFFREIMGRIPAAPASLYVVLVRLIFR